MHALFQYFYQFTFIVDFKRGREIEERPE